MGLGWGLVDCYNSKWLIIILNHLMTDNLEPRKSLWKNLKTEKKKESLA